MKKSGLFLFMLVMLITGCNQTQQHFSIKGNVEELKEGKVLLYRIQNRKFDSLASATIVDGKFELTGSVDSLIQAYIRIMPLQKEAPNMAVPYERKSWERYFPFFVENKNYTITYGKDAFTVGGSDAMNLVNQFMILNQKENEELQELNMQAYREEGELDVEKEKARQDRMRQIQDIIWKNTAEIVNQNMAQEEVVLFYLSQNASAFPPKELKKIAARFSEKTRNSGDFSMINYVLSSVIEEPVEKVALFTADKKLNYTIDAGFSGKALTGFNYLSKLSNDNICGLKDDGTIVIFNDKGGVLKEFKTGLEKTKVFTTDPASNFYIMTSVAAAGDTQAHVLCTVFDKDGKKTRSIMLQGITAASGAKVSDNILFVADSRGRCINMYDAATGEKKNGISNLRPCCGILDFALTPENRVVIANLGAFRVDYYDAEGKVVGYFGERGRLADQFHGCCNPVNVAYLSTGAIVSVEKDPTRIKIYNNEKDATVLEGVKELVQGCSYIPLAVDSKDNLYLASPKDGVVKCKVL